VIVVVVVEPLLWDKHFTICISLLGPRTSKYTKLDL
jgi:hypothetical protein